MSLGWIQGESAQSKVTHYSQGAAHTLSEAQRAHPPYDLARPSQDLVVRQLQWSYHSCTGPQAPVVRGAS